MLTLICFGSLSLEYSTGLICWLFTKRIIVISLLNENKDLLALLWGRDSMSKVRTGGGSMFMKSGAMHMLLFFIHSDIYIVHRLLAIYLTSTEVSNTFFIWLIETHQFGGGGEAQLPCSKNGPLARSGSLPLLLYSWTSLINFSCAISYVEGCRNGIFSKIRTV